MNLAVVVALPRAGGLEQGACHWQGAGNFPPGQLPKIR